MESELYDLFNRLSSMISDVSEDLQCLHIMSLQIMKDVLPMKPPMEPENNIIHLSELNIGALRPEIPISVIQNEGRRGLNRLAQAFNDDIGAVHIPHPDRKVYDRNTEGITKSRRRKLQTVRSNKAIMENFKKQAMRDQQAWSTIDQLFPEIDVKFPEIDRLVDYSNYVLRRGNEFDL